MSDYERRFDAWVAGMEGVGPEAPEPEADDERERKLSALDRIMRSAEARMVEQVIREAERAKEASDGDV